MRMEQQQSDHSPHTHRAIADNVKHEIGEKVTQRRQRRDSLDCVVNAIRQQGSNNNNNNNNNTSLASIIQQQKKKNQDFDQQSFKSYYSSDNKAINPYNINKPVANTTLNRRKEQIGSEKLKTLQNLKSSIAELRPSRRKIKWNNTIESSSGSTEVRVKELDIDDLNIHGNVPLSDTGGADNASVDNHNNNNNYNSTTATYSNNSVNNNNNNNAPFPIPTNPGQHLDDIERKLRRAYKILKRANRETNRHRATAKQIEAQNQQLRKELLAMPAAPKVQSIRQSQRQLASTIDQLRVKLSEIKEQTRMLQLQKSKLQQATSMQQVTTIEKNESDSISALTPPTLASDSTTPMQSSPRQRGALSAHRNNSKRNLSHHFVRMSATPAAA